MDIEGFDSVLYGSLSLRVQGLSQLKSGNFAGNLFK